MKFLITGTRCGIGNSLTRHFAAAGHDIWGISRNAQTEFQAECDQQKLSFRHSRCDISDWNQVAAFRQELGAAWAHVDVLICCAGIQGPLGPSMQLDPLEWSQSIRINLDGTFYTLRAFHDLLLRAQPRAKVICFSGGGSATPRPNFTPYAAAKAGLVRLIETLAKEWAALPIDINALAPGAINTRMTDEVLELGPTIAGEREFTIATEQKRKGGAPLSRVTAAIELLCSRSGDGLSGKLISVPWDPWPTLPGRIHELMASDIYAMRRIVPEDRGQKWS